MRQKKAINVLMTRFHELYIYLRINELWPEKVSHLEDKRKKNVKLFLAKQLQ